MKINNTSFLQSNVVFVKKSNTKIFAGKTYIFLERREKPLCKLIIALALGIFSLGIAFACRRFRTYWISARGVYWIRADLIPEKFRKAKIITKADLTSKIIPSDIDPNIACKSGTPSNKVHQEIASSPANCYKGHAKVSTDLNPNMAWKKWAYSDKERQKEAAKIKNRYSKLDAVSKKFFGPIFYIPGAFSFHMPGVALAASYLKERHQIEKGLYVAETIEAFHAHLKNTLTSNEEGRWAYVIGTTWAGHQHPNFPQHKMTVVVEKKGSQVFLALLDPQADPAKQPSQNVLNSKDFWEGWKSHNFGAAELALRAIGALNLPAYAQVFFSSVPRETVYGCETYALRDAVAFLKDPLFFKKIKTSKTSTRLSSGHPLQEITELPAAFLIGTQRSGTYNSFVQKHKHEPGALQVVGSKKSLPEFWKKYSVNVESKEQNHYITRKMFKDYNKVMEWLEKGDEKFIQQKLAGTLIEGV